MASKKYTFLAAMLALFGSASFAQTKTTDDWGWNWKDTSKVSVKNMPQQNEFLNNQYPYPAKPRNQWELGLSAGSAFILGDRTPFTSSYNGGFVGGISLRKAISHTFSLRAGYDGSIVSIPGAVNAPTFKWSKNYTHMGSFDLIASLNSISHYRGNPKWDVYVLAGYSLIATRVTTNIGGTQHNNYYPQSTGGLITTFGGATVNGRHAWGLMHGANAGAGLSFKLSNRVNLGVEQRFIVPLLGNDYLDGNAIGTKKDLYSYSTARLNINLGNPAKRVQPLWWLNPNNFIYSELNSPKHMKLPKVVLPDADGDGVTDQFDLEPNTPAGAPVDSHGVAKDTDGDGVPDYRDKELLTPQKCFPVNADGIGTCPEPACCKELRDAIAGLKTVATKDCGISNLPSVQFKGGNKLSKDAQTVLASAAAQIIANPNCNVKVIGYGATSKAAQQLSYDRVSAVIKYLTEKQGVSESRLIFVYGQDGDANTVDLQGTTETGPNTVPAPHPNLKSKG